MSVETSVRVAAGDIPAREGRVLVVDGREIAVFNLGDRFLAIDNRCPHKGGPLADGIVSGNAVVCPLHAWRINLESGQVERPAGESACVQQYDVRHVGEFLLIDATANAPDADCRAGAVRCPDAEDSLHANA